MTRDAKGPFAALAALRDMLPPGEAPAAEVSPAGPSWARGRVVVRVERKGRAGKAVTTLRWPDGAPDDAARDALARALRKALGTGAHAEDGAVVVQGELAPRVAAWLRGEGVTRVVEG